MNKSTWDIVKIARHPERPTARDVIRILFPDFLELHGDRHYQDDHALLCGLAMLENLPLTIIAQEKGKSTSEKIRANFGMPHPEGYRKTKRLMKQAEKFHRPVFCIIDTAGAYPGIGAEERGQAWAIADNLACLSQLKVPTIALILSEGGSGGALALALTDEVWMCENATYSILSPEGFASILYKDASLAPEVAKTMKLTSFELLDYHLIDRIIPEAPDGLHSNPSITFMYLQKELYHAFKALQGISDEERLQKRYQKYRLMGEVKEGDASCQK